MKGVILAAGRGTRLSRHHGMQHKALLQVKGRPIIDYTLDAFQDVGVDQVAIVIGHGAHAVKAWIGDGARHNLRVQYVYNPRYRHGNALSLFAARSFAADEPFILSMADHMISSGLLQAVLDVPQPDNVLAVDFSTSSYHLEDATRVQVSGDGTITEIGKYVARWNGVDAGVFRLNPVIFESVGGLPGAEVSEFQLSQAISHMIALGHPLRACDVSGLFWHDVDTWEDLSVVRRTLAGRVSWR